MCTIVLNRSISEFHLNSDLLNSCEHHIHVSSVMDVLNKASITILTRVIIMSFLEAYYVFCSIIKCHIFDLGFHENSY